jgi:hypothetical protein
MLLALIAMCLLFFPREQRFVRLVRQILHQATNLRHRLQFCRAFRPCRPEVDHGQVATALAAARLRTAFSKATGIRALVLTLIAVFFRYGYRNEPADSHFLPQRPACPAGRVATVQ